MSEVRYNERLRRFERRVGSSSTWRPIRQDLVREATAAVLVALGSVSVAGGVGPMGPPGADGADGEPGAPGAPGTAGADGQDAGVEIAPTGATNACWVPLLWTAGNLAAATGGTAAANRMRAFPLPRNLWGKTIDQLGVQVTIGAGGSHVVRMALYEDDGTGYPGALFHDFGELSIASAAVRTTSSGLAKTIPERAWFCMWQSANATLRAIEASTVHAPLGVSSALTDNRGQWWEHPAATYTLGSSTYPSTFAAGATRTASVTGGLPCAFALFA